MRRQFPAAFRPVAATAPAPRARTRLEGPRASGRALTGWGTGGDGLAPFTIPELVPWSRDAAMSIPTVSRARDLICSLIGSLPFQRYSVDWSQDPPVEQNLALAPWMIRPDPYRTRNWLLAWTTDDLLFWGRAYWLTVARYADGFPQSFVRVPTAELGTGSGEYTWQGDALDPLDLIEFLSPTEGLLTAGARAMRIGLELDLSAERYVRMEVPAGILQENPGGEPSDAAYLAEQADAFALGRHRNAIAALNNLFSFHESTLDPNRLQLTEARGYQALELARIANVPPYLVGAPAGTGMTYQNAQQARGDLVDFGAMPYVNAIEQTLSGPNVLPSGQFVRLDVNAWLRSPTAVGIPTPGPDQAPSPAPTPGGSPP